MMVGVDGMAVFGLEPSFLQVNLERDAKERDS